MRRFLTVLASVVLLIQCTDISYRQVSWHFIIPDNYEGFLAIQYECLGGSPLSTTGATIRVRFRDDGTFCTSDAAFAWQGEYMVETRSGQPVVAGGLWERKGYGFYGDGVYSFGEPPRQQFHLYWVGDMEGLAAIRNTTLYAEQLTAFLEDRFGITIR